MDTKSIIKSLQQERTKIDKAISLLQGTEQEPESNGTVVRRHRMSAAARKKISIAQKKRHAKNKKEEAGKEA